MQAPPALDMAQAHIVNQYRCEFGGLRWSGRGRRQISRSNVVAQPLQVLASMALGVERPSRLTGYIAFARR